MYKNLLVLHLVSDTDVEIGTKTLVLSRGDQVVECDETLLEVLCLHVGQSLQHELEDGNKVGLQSLDRHISDDCVDELESMRLMRLGRDELLENTKNRFQLLVGNDTLCIASDHGTEQACERRDVATLIPDGTLDDD